MRVTARLQDTVSEGERRNTESIQGLELRETCSNDREEYPGHNAPAYTGELVSLRLERDD
jgi:hypothetical protein